MCRRRIDNWNDFLGLKQAKILTQHSFDSCWGEIWEWWERIKHLKTIFLITFLREASDVICCYFLSGVGPMLLFNIAVYFGGLYFMKRDFGRCPRLASKLFCLQLICCIRCNYVLNNNLLLRTRTFTKAYIFTVKHMLLKKKFSRAGNAAISKDTT